MDAIRIDYAGMNAGAIIAWILIATAAGLIARSAVRGRKLMGLWGDMAIGLIGVFLIGTLFRAFHFDLSVWLKSIEPDWQFDLRHLDRRRRLGAHRRTAAAPDPAAVHWRQVSATQPSGISL